MPDIARWSDPESHSPRWSGRTEIIGRYLQDCARVLDLGSGRQALKTQIRGEYIPIDCVSFFPDTIILDFDSHWTAADLPSADGVAISGLLEHIRDPIGMIAKLSGIGQKWAVSYMDRRRCSERGLVSFCALEAAFIRASMRIRATEPWRGQRIYLLERA